MVRFNGWQRLWVVATGLAAVWFVGIWPLQEHDSFANVSYHSSLMRDFDSGQCESYMTRPLAQLSEPEYEPRGGTCWFIYTTRQTNSIETVPFTREAADQLRTTERLKNYGLFLLVGVVGLVVFSGALYGSGALVAWVRRGFRGDSRS